MTMTNVAPILLLIGLSGCDDGRGAAAEPDPIASEASLSGEPSIEVKTDPADEEAAMRAPVAAD